MYYGCNIIFTISQFADFGLSTDERRCVQFGIGTRGYMSPGKPAYLTTFTSKRESHAYFRSLVECLGGFMTPVWSYDSFASDVWSLGVVLLNLIILSKQPWVQVTKNDEDFCQFLREARNLSGKFLTSEWDVLLGILCREGNSRISVDELLEKFC